MSDTPETDNAGFPFRDLYEATIVPADFARTLERERDKLRSEVNAFSSKMPCGHLRRFGTAGITSPIHCIACERDQLRKGLALAEIARDKALITVRQLESENRELAARVDVGNALRNLLAIILQHGLTDQVRAEAEELLKP